MYALLIGVDHYLNEGIKNLRGAVADVNAMKGFLVKFMHVSEERIQTLLDKDATREGILSALTVLSENEAISKDDPILIFYAGHGAETTPPDDWDAGGSNARIQMICPYAFDPMTSEKLEAQGLLDYELGQSLDILAKIKGDNIVRSIIMFRSENSHIDI